MIRIIIAAAILLACSIPTEARQRHRAIIAHEQCNLPGPNSMPCEGVAPSPRGEKIANMEMVLTIVRLGRRPSKADWDSVGLVMPPTDVRIEILRRKP